MGAKVRSRGHVEVPQNGHLVAFDAARFREALAERHLTIYGLAKRIGMLRQLSTLKKLSRAGPGRTVNPGLRLLIAIEGLDVPDPWLGGDPDFQAGYVAAQACRWWMVQPLRFWGTVSPSPAPRDHRETRAR